MKDISKKHVEQNALPCPFCGSHARLELVTFENAPSFYRLYCTGPEKGNCGIGPYAAGRTRVATLTEWNMRSNAEVSGRPHHETEKE